MPEDFRDFFSKLTDDAKMSLERAGSIAHSKGSPYIGTEHLLLGVLANGNSVGARFLAQNEIDFEKVDRFLNYSPKTLLTTNDGPRGMSETAKMTLRMSWDIAKNFQQDYLGTEHIIFSLLSQMNSRASVLFREMDVNVFNLRRDLQSVIQRSESSDQRPRRRNLSKSALNKFGVDLVKKAQLGKLDPVIGRSNELSRIMTILSRKSKNNPLLIGEPGVGKTAVVEALSLAIANGEVASSLLNSRIFHIDLMSMLAGTKYRGQFEERFKKLLDEVKDDKNIILFIDEIHLITGAGAAEGSLDAANMIKPAMARGEVRLIGATTFDEFKKTIEKDSALSRRFQNITIKEPTFTETVEIAKGLRRTYEEHHRVKISQEVLVEAINLAERYISNRFFPDKALDILDEAAALAKISLKPSRKEMKLIEIRSELAQEILRLEESGADDQVDILRNEIEEVEVEIESNRKAPDVTSDDIKRAVELMTGIPASKIHGGELKRFANLEQVLAKDIIGQKEAVAKVARAIKRGRSRVSSENKPVGSFVFLGPTGVGKTELTKSIARQVYGSEKALVRLDMSEFGEKHTMSRMLGAPAGYVGYEEGGQLTDKIRRQPYSVVLFDEMEKAHPDIFNVLLQILDTGTLTDASGRSVDFTHTVVILTGNLGSNLLHKDSSIGFSGNSENYEAYKKSVEKELRRFMKPETIGRFDEVIVFDRLSEDDAFEITKKYAEELKLRMSKNHKIKLKITPSVLRHVVASEYNDKDGARKLRRGMQVLVEDEIADALIHGKIEAGSNVAVRLSRKKVVVE